MPESQSEDQPNAQPGGDATPGSSPSGSRESRRMRITPEQRRFLGPARTKHDWVGAEEKAEAAPPSPGGAGPAGPRKFADEYVPPAEEAFGTPPVAGWTGKSAEGESTKDREPEE